MPELKITPALIKMTAGAIATVFMVFLFMDSRHSHPDDLECSSADTNQRILMSDSTRYAEINKYYTDKLKGGETLSKAETSRLELVQRQQQRINEILVGKE